MKKKTDEYKNQYPDFKKLIESWVGKELTDKQVENLVGGFYLYLLGKAEK